MDGPTTEKGRHCMIANQARGTNRRANDTLKDIRHWGAEVTQVSWNTAKNRDRNQIANSV